MKTKLFLTSLTAIAIAMPAMAEPSHTSSTFAENDLMQEDYTYQNQANYTNMGLYEGSVNAVAEYENIPYTVNAGQYLPQSSTTVTTCTAGSFCPGLPSAVNYSTTTNQGITSCATVGDNTYTQSDTGASADTQCYRACSGNVTIQHATGVTGNDYYGAGVDTCEPTGCENGWTLKPGAPDLNTIIGTVTGSGSKSGTTFSVTYSGKGTITGKSQCSTRGVENMWNDNNNTFASDNFTENLPDSAGDYCYCQLDSWTPDGGSAQSLSTPWVVRYYEAHTAGECTDKCANRCAQILQNDSTAGLAFRAAVFGSLGSSLASCEANTITINWTDVDPTYAGQNNEGTATYGGDIRTPFKALDKTNEGKSFKGWRFEKPTPSQGN